jgi:hypothetical protein
MQSKLQKTFLEILIGEKLSSVVFVMDYLQLDFDGNRFTFNIWPIVTVDNKQYKYGDSNYRDKLCLLIAKNVTRVTLQENKELVIEFGAKDQIILSLDPNNPEIITPEIATFNDTDNNLYIL